MWKSVVLPFTLCLGVGAAAVSAHEGATGMVHERMNTMKSMASAMKALAEMFNEPGSFDRDQAQKASETVATHADSIPRLFPEGSDHPPTKALQAVWSDWDGFVARAADLHETALAFGAAAEAGVDLSAIKPDFEAMAKNCQECHEDFRQPGGGDAF